MSMSEKWINGNTFKGDRGTIIFTGDRITDAQTIIAALGTNGLTLEEYRYLKIQYSDVYLPDESRYF
jgi:hypothetical protein